MLVYINQINQCCLQIFLQTPNVKMTALALNQTLNRIPYIASKLGSSLAPFFFVKQNLSNKLSKDSNITLKINRYMSPFLTKLPKNVRLGFWSAAQFQSSLFPKEILSTSIIINPFKTQKLIRSSFVKGINKLLVSDVQELIKVQELYFKLLKQGMKIKEPEYVWAIESLQSDIQNVIDLQNCNLPINGFYFTKDLNLHQINKFVQNKKIYQKNLLNFRQIELDSLNSEKQYLKAKGIQPLITNYSQTNNYLMICRIIGKDRQGKPVFDTACLDFICNSEFCNCPIPSIKIQNVFSTGKDQWAILKPARLDKLRQEFIKQ